MHVNHAHDDSQRDADYVEYLKPSFFMAHMAHFITHQGRHEESRVAEIGAVDRPQLSHRHNGTCQPNSEKHNVCACILSPQKFPLKTLASQSGLHVQP